MSKPSQDDLARRPVPVNIFPTFDTLEEAQAYAKAQLPVDQWNKLQAILWSYHNTLLAQLNTPNPHPRQVRLTLLAKPTPADLAGTPVLRKPVKTPESA